MKYLQIFLLLGMVLVMLGCDGNDLIVKNDADYQVCFYFRGQEYILSPGQSTSPITDIPSASYQYGTVYSVPQDYEVDAQEGLSGMMDFYAKSTSISLTYKSYTVEDDSTYKYVIYGVVSSSHPSSSNPTDPD